MCKTSRGACFAQRRRAPARSSHDDDGDTEHVRYACAHWLADLADRRLCLAAATARSDYVIGRRVTSSWTELACCDTDMCNYYYFRSRQDVDVRANNGKRLSTYTIGAMCDLNNDKSFSANTTFTIMPNSLLLPVALIAVYFRE